jgi:hypothetical protein
MREEKRAGQPAGWFAAISFSRTGTRWLLTETIRGIEIKILLGFHKCAECSRCAVDTSVCQSSTLTKLTSPGYHSSFFQFIQME